MLNQVLTQETRDSLAEFANAGLQTINYTTYITQITSQISTLAVDSTISTLVTVRDGLVIGGQVSIRGELLTESS